MAEWTHRVCERCWFDSELGMSGGGIYRLPAQVKDDPPGACCRCGGMTVTGIYFREDQEQLLCRGRHDSPAEWSQVVVMPGG